MKDMMTIDEYTQKIKDILKKDCAFRAEDYERAYDEYCKLDGKRTPDVLYVDLLKNPFFVDSYNVRGFFSQFWLLLSDMNKYLLKELPHSKFFKKRKIIYTRDNAMIVPKIVESSGLEAAQYYIVNWVMDDSIDTWEDDFLLTPSFLQDGDEMLSFKNILGRECLDIEIIEESIRRELELRHFKKSNIDKLIFELRKTICMNEIIDNTDISSENMSIIFNDGNVRMAPMYDFDFCMGNKSAVEKHLKIKGEEGLKSVLQYYKQDIQLMNWLRNNILTMNIDEILLDKPTSPNQRAVADNIKSKYKEFWGNQMEIVRACIDIEPEQGKELV